MSIYKKLPLKCCNPDHLQKWFTINATLPIL